METEYRFLRPEQAERFDLDKFKEEVESLTDFKDQLEIWNKYFDLPSMGRGLSVDDTWYKTHFHFYCERPDCLKGFTPERQDILTEWRKEHFRSLKSQFDELLTYKERIDFSLSHFRTSFCMHAPEGIEFNTMPQTTDEHNLYYELVFKGWEKRFNSNPQLSEKSFDYRKNQFNIRIVNTLFPDKELESEISTIYDEYYQPNKTWVKSMAHYYAHVIIFRERWKGILLDFSESVKRNRSMDEIMLSMEGENAYRYYNHLVKLQGTPNWLNEITKDINPTTLILLASDEETNTFNYPMPLDEVRQWFKQLAETNSKNGKPFLTVEQVGQFIDRAFCGNDTIQELTFNMGDGERTSITKLFYLFYNRCTNDYAIEPTKHCKEKYVRLLTDNFTNYNYSTVFGTFNNSKNAPKEWKITV